MSALSAAVAAVPPSALRHVPVPLPVLLLLLGGCAHPSALTDDRIFGDLAARYADYHHGEGDHDARQDADLVRPQLGIPALARVGDSFVVEWLERGGAAEVHVGLVPHSGDEAAGAGCLQPSRCPGCVGLVLDDVTRTPIGDRGISRVRARARPTSSGAAAGSYDLMFASGHDRPFRASRAVWLRDYDPAAPRPLRVALLSDPHVGKRAHHLEENFNTVIGELNGLQPDLVLVTGDITNLGQDATLGPRARAFLERVDAPLFVVIGNHDHGFGSRTMFSQEHGAGYFNFSRSFHPLLYYEMTVGGWDFVGFDSGPSRPSPTVNNRGLAPETLSRIEDALAAAGRDKRRGVILFSHCTSRASLSGRSSPSYPGAFGRMAAGGPELERMELQAVDAGLRVLHLGGHTHWSDLFEARRAADGRWQYQLVPRAPLEGKRPLTAPAAIVTVQAATHPGLFVKESARGFGYAALLLGERTMELEYVRHLGADIEAPRPGDPFVADAEH